RPCSLWNGELGWSASSITQVTRITRSFDRESGFGHPVASRLAKDQAWWHASPSEQGGWLQRSSRPQQVRPAGRAVRPLVTKGTDSSLSSE
ncbi:MAG: hypothetical protein PVH11_06110, partial [Anaerolineae bacterium]